MILTGKTFYKVQKENKYIWKSVVIHSYDSATETFKAEFRDMKYVVWTLPRIYICFDAENPLKFCLRFYKAVKRRNITDMLIRYNFIIDSIPLDYDNGIK